MIKVKNIYNGNEVYFQFFASNKYPNCFWYTKQEDLEGFELARINDYQPLNETWEELKNE